jgi:hypothetical protein
MPSLLVDGLPVLFQMLPNFVHDLFIARIVAQAVPILVALKPGIVVIAKSDGAP